MDHLSSEFLSQTVWKEKLYANVQQVFKYFFFGWDHLETHVWNVVSNVKVFDQSLLQYLTELQLFVTCWWAAFTGESPKIQFCKLRTHKHLLEVLVGGLEKWTFAQTRSQIKIKKKYDRVPDGYNKQFSCSLHSAINKYHFAKYLSISQPQAKSIKITQSTKFTHAMTDLLQNNKDSSKPLSLWFKKMTMEEDKKVSSPTLWCIILTGTIFC